VVNLKLVAQHADVYQRVSAVCPIVRIDWRDRTAERIVYAENATDAQKAAAEKVIADFDWTSTGPDVPPLTSDEILKIRALLKR